MAMFLANRCICIEPKELGESSVERNRELRLINGTKKGRRQQAQGDRDIFNRYKSSKYYHREEENNFTF